ncbi:angio-associated migratory cell protein [Pseudomyrmex gracilis]|uniref:angio-associated migratory cell protein n=1 Tax=Pseudomyrmex gracilis TaxID=219809 RepID=UPI000994BB92|nr:angio-associated migratory cell protein [Pseudomyrmex gracilis]XP_020283799.1 angio-associated migratory cell protein [Pseudomyrmex gracilis]
MDDFKEKQTNANIIPKEDDHEEEVIQMTDEMVFDTFSEDEEEEVVSLEDEDEFTEEEYQKYLNEEEEIENKDDAVLVFRGHRPQNGVFCCALSKDAQLAATGGQDDKAFLWNAVTGEIIIECTGFEDSVISVGFNHNDKYMAAADMSGIIKVWHIENKTCIWQVNIENIVCMQWHKSSNVLLVGVTSGNLYMYNIPDGNVKVFAQGYGDPLETFVIFPDGLRAAVGFESGKIHVLDLKTNTVLSRTPSDPKRLHGHQYSVLTIDCHLINNTLISGSKSGQVIISSASTGKVLSVLYDPNPEPDKTITVESVVFSTIPSSFNCAAAAILEDCNWGRIVIWDVNTFTIRYNISKLQGILKLIWTNDNILFATGINGPLLGFSVTHGSCSATFPGHKDKILDLHICEKTKRALTVSDDSTARIFDVSGNVH